MTNFSGFNTENRGPWNNVIFPGNQVTPLQAYRNQGVQSIPGVNFFRVVGAIIVPAGDGVTGTLTGLEIHSPDLRQDDKPRLNRSLVIPEYATIYRSALNVENLTAASGVEVSLGKAENMVDTQFQDICVLTAGDDGFGKGGASSAYTPDATRSKISNSQGITPLVISTGALSRVDPNSQAAVLVEICFYMDAPGPCAEDVHLPYLTEAGQSAS